MSDKKNKFLNYTLWFTSLLVSFSVGLSMIGGSLTIPFLDSLGIGIATIVLGWMIIASTLLVIILSAFKE